MPPRLGSILVNDGACEAGAVREALRNQVIFGGRLGTNLLEIHGVREDALARALGKQHGLPSVSGDVQLSPDATALLTAEIADRCDVVPYMLADRRLAMLVVDPRNLAMLDEVAFATGKLVHPVVAPEARVWALLRRTYGIDRNLRGIEVEFARIRRGEPGPGGLEGEPEAGGLEPARKAPAPGGDLIGESEFSALYARPAPTPPPARTPPPVGQAPLARPALTPPPAGLPAAPRSTPPTPTPAPTPPPAFLPVAEALEDDVIELTDILQPEEPVPPPAAPPAPIVAEVLAALSQRPGHAPPARLVPAAAAPRAPEPEPSPLSFEDASRFLEGVDERDAIAKTVLRYARSKFKRAVLLTVQRGAAHGWAGLGERLGADAVRRMHLALGTPGILDTVARTQAHFLGPIPKTESNIRLLKGLGGGVPANALVVPILALGRVVNLFYADNGKGGMVQSGDVGELLILATRIAKSYDALLARVR